MPAPFERKGSDMTTEARCDIGIIMGSQSDWETMRHAADTLDRLGIAYETRIVSAHRTPDRLYEYARTAQGARAARRSSPAPAAPRICRGWRRR